MVKIANKEKIRVAVYECLMWFTYSKKLYILVYKKLFVPQMRLSYALLFYISLYFIEEIVMLQCYGVFG
jgi:hypothetical protein